jgi:hypothetical protein
LPQERPSTNEYLAPRTALEEALSLIWAQVLGVERVGVHDNFFELGGHSLLAMHVATRVRVLLEMELPLVVLFDTPTIAAVAEHLIRRIEGVMT